MQSLSYLEPLQENCALWLHPGKTRVMIRLQVEKHVKLQYTGCSHKIY